MKKLLFILVILLSTLIQSCGSGESESQYDIYRVEVNTFLNIRATPSKKGKVLERIDNGALIEVIEIKDGWAKVNYHGDKPAYVASEYLTLVKKHKAEANPKDDADTKDTASETALDAEAAHAHSPVLKTEISLVDSVNVYFMGDTTMLSSLDRSLIYERLAKSPEYIFIINTVPSVDPSDMFDYSPDLLDRLTEDMDASIGSGKTVTSFFSGDSPSSNVVLLSYIRSFGLLQAESNGNSMRYLKTSTPEEYFKIQMTAKESPVLAICNMGMAISGAGKKYELQNWFGKSQTQTGYLSDLVCETWIVQNILPRNSFWHNWVFGWIFALPVKLANFVLGATSSFSMTMLVLALLNLLVYCTTIIGCRRDPRYDEGCLAQLALLVNLFLWLSILSMLIYMIPEMSNLVAMEEAGFSSDLISIARSEYLTGGFTKNFLLAGMALAGIFLASGIEPNYALNATLPSSKQVQVFSFDRPKVMNNIRKRVLNHTDPKEITSSNTPFTDLFLKYCMNIGVIQTFYIWTPLAFVCSGTLLLLVTIFAWTMAMNRIIQVGIGAISYLRKGFY